MTLTELLLLISLTAMGNCNNPCTQRFVNSINSLGTTWTAKISASSIQMPTVCDNMDIANMPMQEVPIMSAIPSEFDARNAWSHCQTIRSIYNQAACGSCWVGLISSYLII